MSSVQKPDAFALATQSHSYFSPNTNSFSSSMASPDSSLPQITPEYLQELLKDKRSIQSFPNVFHHVERILEAEITRARSVLYHQNGSTTVRLQLDDLPDGEGPIVTVQEKVYIPVKENPNYNFVGRLLGPRGMTAKQLETDLDCKIMVRGMGSMRDKKKEEQNRGKPNWEHLADDLHVLVCVEDHENRAEIKAKRAADEIRVFLEQAVKMPTGADPVLRSQLIELAVLNNPGPQPSGMVPWPAAATDLKTYHHHHHHLAIGPPCLQATRASNAAAALSAAAAAAASVPLVPTQPASAAAAFLRLPHGSAAAAGGLPGHPHFLLAGQQQQQQHQQLLGLPLVQPAAGDLSSYLLAAAAAAANASSAGPGAAAVSAPRTNAAAGADPSAAAMMALMYPGIFDVSGQAGPIKSRQGSSVGLRTHPYSRPGF